MTGRDPFGEYRNKTPSACIDPARPPRIETKAVPSKISKEAGGKGKEGGGMP